MKIRLYPQSAHFLNFNRVVAPVKVLLNMVKKEHLSTREGDFLTGRSDSSSRVCLPQWHKEKGERTIPTWGIVLSFQFASRILKNAIEKVFCRVFDVGMRFLSVKFFPKFSGFRQPFEFFQVRVFELEFHPRLLQLDFQSSPQSFRACVFVRLSRIAKRLRI